MTKKTLIIITIVLVLTLSFLLIFTNAKKESDQNILSSYPRLTDNNHIVRTLTPSEVETRLDNKASFILMMGFERCPWCQQLMPIYNDAAKDANLDVVYYVDILDMRSNVNSKDRSCYDKLYKLTKDYLDVRRDRIGAPTILVIKNGETVIGHLGTLDGHDYVDGKLPLLTEEQVNELKQILITKFNKFK